MDRQLATEIFFGKKFSCLKCTLVQIFLNSDDFFLVEKLPGDVGPKIQVAQKGLKHIMVLDFLKSDEIYEIL